jgi:hypothetical protein
MAFSMDFLFDGIKNDNLNVCAQWEENNQDSETPLWKVSNDGTEALDYAVQHDAARVLRYMALAARIDAARLNRTLAAAYVNGSKRVVACLMKLGASAWPGAVKAAFEQEDVEAINYFVVPRKHGGDCRYYVKKLIDKRSRHDRQKCKAMVRTMLTRKDMSRPELNGVWRMVLTAKDLELPAYFIDECSLPLNYKFHSWIEASFFALEQVQVHQLNVWICSDLIRRGARVRPAGSQVYSQARKSMLQSIYLILMIARYKNDPSECFITKLPLELIIEIMRLVSSFLIALP